ncbi:hypothetical protein DNTS_001268 [Danionella cerebrum]|uniref:Ig-like domain-containing protein n=1 Tax=Danionella cerebrum TaxID=2873325 RepID=A0A553MZX4_9TELE|nr:hypothetical protein DNTS_001268 [Danionella translucida]
MELNSSPEQYLSTCGRSAVVNPCIGATDVLLEEIVEAALSLRSRLSLTPDTSLSFGVDLYSRFSKALLEPVDAVIFPTALICLSFSPGQELFHSKVYSVEIKQPEETRNPYQPERCSGAQNISHSKRIQTSKPGSRVTIECILPKKDFNHMAWYKQEIGGKLQLISHTYIYMNNAKFEDAFKNGRFNITIAPGVYHLSISPTEKKDAAMYFCGVLFLGEIIFEEQEGATVIQEQIYEEVHFGDNITLQCRVETERRECEDKRRVFWFRTTDRIFHSDEEDCESNGILCTYSLKKINIDQSDAGMYYCALLQCDEILFGNGTLLQFSSGDDVDFTNKTFLILASLNLVSVTVMILLLAALFKDKGRAAVSCNGSDDQETSEDSRVGGAYSTVSFSSKSRSSSRGKSQNQELYSQTK